MRSHGILPGVLVALVAGLTLHACGGENGGMSSMSSMSTVSAYVTDDLGGYESVVLTVNRVEIRHPSGRTCQLIGGPLTFRSEERRVGKECRSRWARARGEDK